MKRLLLLAGAVLLVAACDNATAPKAKGPGCWLVKDVDLGDGYGVTIRTKHDDCTKKNLDSLQADGWRVVWI